MDERPYNNLNRAHITQNVLFCVSIRKKYNNIGENTLNFTELLPYSESKTYIYTF